MDKNNMSKTGLPKGICYISENKKPFRAVMYLNGKAIYLGDYATVDEACDAEIWAYSQARDMIKGLRDELNSKDY